MKVSFYDPVRLNQDLESVQESGEACLAEVGLIILPSVTRKYMEKPFQQLSGRGISMGWSRCQDSANDAPSREPQ